MNVSENLEIKNLLVDLKKIQVEITDTINSSPDLDEKDFKRLNKLAGDVSKCLIVLDK